MLDFYFNCDEHLDQILKNQLYYARTGPRPGSLRIEQGFDTCKYLLLHYKQRYLMYKLTGKAPRLFTAQHLTAKGFSVRQSDESYLAYDLASTEPLSFEDINVQNAILQGIGNRTADSYFTTLKKLFNIQ